MAHRKAAGSELVKIVDFVISMVRQDGAKIADLGTKVTEAYLEIASTETVWTQFETEVVNPTLDDFKELIELLRKRYCTFFSALINRQTRNYIRALAKTTGEIMDIHPEFVKVCQLLLEANRL